MDCGYFHDTLVSICDDGSIEEPARNSIFFGKFILHELPPKSVWSNPCIPLNISVRNTSSSMILLQSPETYHPYPIIHLMSDLIDHPKKIVLCPVRCDGHRKLPWYAHPVLRPVRYWFCQLMTRQFFDEIGGMNECFRKMQGYEDNDFVKRLDKAGAKWEWLTDHYVVHVKTPRNRSMPKSGKNLYTQLWQTG